VNGASAVVLPQIKVLGTGPLPSSSVSSFADLDSGCFFSRMAGRNFYMQDQSGGLLISPHGALDLKPGDRLEVTC
jgi:hypothetical protein